MSIQKPGPVQVCIAAARTTIYVSQSDCSERKNGKVGQSVFYSQSLSYKQT